MTVTLASGTSSSSAAICAKDVLMPWPISTLPLSRVTCPAPSILIQESTSFGEISGAIATCAEAKSGLAETLKRTTIAPVPCRNARRSSILPSLPTSSGGMCTGLMAALPHCLRRTADRLHDSRMRAATTEIVRKGFADLAFIGICIPFEKCRRVHDHAVVAVPTLGSLLVNERMLNRLRLFGCTKALERDDLRIPH